MSERNQKDTVILRGGMEPHGRAVLPSSKSELHRLLICACFAEAGTHISYCGGLPEDVKRTADGLEKLGAVIEVSENQIEIRKSLCREALNMQAVELFCGDSAATARFFLPLAAYFCKEGTVLSGSEQLSKRPMEDICVCLEAQGAILSSHRLPIRIDRGMISVENETPEIRGDLSSQYLSGLLMLLPVCGAEGIRQTSALVSPGYVMLTEKMMERFGIDIKENQGVYSAVGAYRKPEGIVHAGGDWSHAAVFLCGTKASPVTVCGLQADSMQPDRKILEYLNCAGFKLSWNGDALTAQRGRALYPIDVDAAETPDLVPVLAVLGTTLPGETRIRNAGRLKYKESNRLDAVCRLIRVLGGDVFSDGNSLYVQGNAHLWGGCIDSLGDHRIAMAAAAAAVYCDGRVTVRGASAVEKSWPSFWETYRQIYKGVMV